MVRMGELGAGQILVAWVERGEPDLEFDALRAVPPVSAKSSAVEGASVRLVLA